MSMFYTYVIKSLKDNLHYIGWTSDLRNRLLEYNRGEVLATRSRIPFKLVYYEACLDKKKAIEREKYFKSGFGRRCSKNRI